MKTYARVAAAAAHTLGVIGIVQALFTPPITSAKVTALPPPPRSWAPPAWFPEEGADALWMLPELDGPALSSTGPQLRARSAIVADLDAGQVLWSLAPDAALPVASLTKITTALAFASTGSSLDRELCVDASLYPDYHGARSKFATGSCHEGWSYLGGALVASDNRGAMGLSVLSGLDHSSFLQRMGEIDDQLGMRGSWADPTGLDDGNLASARGMLKGIIALAAHPDLANAASAPSWTIERHGRPTKLGTTNRLEQRWETLAAKTGYTDTARYCFAQVIRTASGRTLATVVLGSPTRSSRFDDTERLIAWAEKH